MQHQSKERQAVMLHMPFRGINMELTEYIFFSTEETKKMPKKNKKKKKKKNKNKKRKNNGKQTEEPEEKNALQFMKTSDYRENLLKDPSEPHLCFGLHARVWLIYTQCKNGCLDTVPLFVFK